MVTHNSQLANTTSLTSGQILLKHGTFYESFPKTESHFASVKHPNLQMYYTKCFYGMVNTKKVTKVIEQFPYKSLFIVTLLLTSRHVIGDQTPDAWESRT